MIRSVTLICSSLLLIIFLEQPFAIEHPSTFVRDKYQIPFVTKAPKLDGKIDDLGWREALSIDKYYQFTPLNGAPPTEKTVAYLYYDTHNLYVAFRCYDSQPSKIRATLTPRNQWLNNDNVFIYLDTYDNKRDQFLFMINPLGVQSNSFDTIWFSRARIDSFGWSGELAIPFKSLRFPDKEKQEWGFVLGRSIHRKGEHFNSVNVDYDDDFYSMFPLLTGLNGLPRSHNLEFLPYGAARHSKGIKFKEQNAAAGMDIKYGFASNLVLDASFAPDFSQVESDPFFVNLTPYEYQLAENRPFFNEGSAIFTLPYTHFYSRRIENPELMVKLTGKEGPWNVGVINAWDNPKSERDRFIHTERLQREILKTSKIGFMISGIEDGSFYNRNFSADGQFNQGMYHRLHFQLASTFNSENNNKNNTLFYLQHAVAPYQGVSYNLTYVDIAPNYDPKTGIIGQKGYRNGSIALGYIWHLPDWGIEILSVSSSANYSKSYSGLDIGKSGGISLSCLFIKKINFGLSFSQSLDRSQILRHENLVWNENSFMSNGATMSMSSNTGSTFDVKLSYSYSHGLGLYMNDFQEQKTGINQSLGLGFIVRPKPNVLINNSTNWYRQTLKDLDALLYDNWLLRNSVHYQITRHWFSRIINNLDISGKSQLIDFLIGYEFHAGSTFYLSYKEMRNNFKNKSNYLIFGKMSYLFRL